ncbi:MAG: PVC-type heme-binding CxxCH protein [Verrucomicrobiales bacterium]
MPFRFVAAPFCISLISASALGADDAKFPKIYNTQEETIKPLMAEEALKRIKLPEGFLATLFAGEPAVHQPIAMTFDSRGRLWVAENYTYAEAAINFDTKLRDQITILEDSNHDGNHDKRTVFFNQAQKLTSLAVGFGGVYALCPPNLLFIPDRDANDIPDGEPEIVLDGFDGDKARHTLANGLKWGPDGWLYGRQGILGQSLVGKPGAPKEERTQVNGSIWRFHPTRRLFEMVAHGTTNPWGHDWDEHGELFFINTVIGHLWHAVPGAYFKRMFGQPYNPHVYEEIEQTADHVHWDTKEAWSDIREVFTQSTSKAGGGHAHTGLMIYQGGNWPAEYRNQLFTLNYHGKRINRDILSRHGATYIGKHGNDVLSVDDPYFRGIELLNGPEGAVYVADWSDIGECHDDNGIHRTSGRVYRISYGEPKTTLANDISKLSNDELVQLVAHSNEWHVRQGRLALQERAAAGFDMSVPQKELRNMLTTAKEAKMKLRALWALNAVGEVDSSVLRSLLSDADEHVRVWAIRLLVDAGAPSKDVIQEFARMAAEEKSGLVATYLASALQRISNEQKWPVALALAQREEWANDRVFPFMVWYGVESAIPSHPENTVKLIELSRLNKIMTFAARRVFEALPTQAGAADGIVQAVGRLPKADQQLATLNGIKAGLIRFEKPVPPKSWKEVAPRLIGSNNRAVSSAALELDALFGNADSLAALQGKVINRDLASAERLAALQLLMKLRPTGLGEMLQSLLTDKQLSKDAVRALATLGVPELPKILLAQVGKMEPQTRVEVIGALVARPHDAVKLAKAVQRGVIKREEVNAAHLRQLRGYDHAELKQLLALIWPQGDNSPEGKSQLFAKYKSLATTENIAKANPLRGREVYQLSCAPCHKLYGDGGTVGPELTGSDRKNLDYLFENVISPSSVVPDAYRVSIVNLKDDRVLNGMILESNEQTLTIQTINEKLVVQRSDIESIQESQLSMMPDGLLENLDEQQVQDLFSYLTSSTPPAGK